MRKVSRIQAAPEARDNCVLSGAAARHWPPAVLRVQFRSYIDTVSLPIQHAVNLARMTRRW
jgi:hypothetical protein